jgi:hypothetical protein
VKYHHLGIPTRTQQNGETYLAEFKMHVTDHERNPFGIQWMRFEADSPLPDLVREIPHVCFEVENLEDALRGREILIAPNSPSEGVMVAFIKIDGAPVELLQFVEKT